MNRSEALGHLEMGAELDGLLLTAQGRVVARGKIGMTGTVLSVVETGRAVSIQLSMRGDRLDVPLVEGVSVKAGEPLHVEFGPKWERQRQRA